MSRNILHIIFEYLDRNYTIDGFIIIVDMESIDELMTLYQNVTNIDVEISEMFGVDVDVYFWKWAESRIGENVTVRFKQGDRTFVKGVESKYSKPEILKGIQQGKLKNANRWKPLN